jgi:threonine/homoserine/homoserine lactone efflux protein
VVVQVLGGLYLIHLGIDAYRHRQEHADDMIKVEEIKPSNFQILRQGFTVGALNPKALVFFSAVFPQFVDSEAGSITFQLLMFGLIFAFLSFILDGSWGLLVGSSRDWFVTSKNRLVVLRTIGAAVMMALGVGVLVPLIIGYINKKRPAIHWRIAGRLITSQLGSYELCLHLGNQELQSIQQLQKFQA